MVGNAVLNESKVEMVAWQAECGQRDICNSQSKLGFCKTVRIHQSTSFIRFSDVGRKSDHALVSLCVRLHRDLHVEVRLQ